MWLLLGLLGCPKVEVQQAPTSEPVTVALPLALVLVLALVLALAAVLALVLGCRHVPLQGAPI